MRISSHFLAKNQKGFTLIEALVMVIIFSIMTLGFYRVYGLAMVTMLDAKKRLAAVEIANQELETLRNTPYEFIKLDFDTLPSSGFTQLVSTPAPDNDGPVEFDSTITVGGNNYRIIREIYFVADAQDGLSSPADEYPEDYKNVIITVRWGNGIGVDPADPSASEVQLSSYYIPPRGNEQAIVNGVVSINVIDENGIVPNIYVGIQDINGATAPDYTANDVTDANGNVTFAAVPRGQKVYEITVGDGSDNYEVITTLPDYPTSSFYPIYTDLSVVAGTVSILTVQTDLIPDLDFTSTDPYCGPIPNVTFDVKGGRILGFEPLTNDPVYVNGSPTPLSVTTDVNGYIDMDSVTDFTESAGIYEIDFSSGLYTLWRLSPGDDINRAAIQVEPDIDTDCNMLLMDNALDSVFVEVIDQDTGAPVPEAVVRLRNVGLGYSAILLSDQFGTTYFPENGTDALTNGAEYEVRVTGEGYVDSQSLVTVTGLEQLSITLESIIP